MSRPDTAHLFANFGAYLAMLEFGLDYTGSFECFEIITLGDSKGRVVRTRIEL
jgi:hypothetical protein